MNASRYGVGRLVVFLCAAGALADTSEHLYAPDGSFYATLPHAAEPFRSDETSLAWLQSRPGLVETETDVGFDTRAVSVRQYLKSDSTKSLDSLVLWEAYYPELSDYLSDAMLQKRRDLFWDEMTRRAAKDTSSQPMRFELPVKVPEWAKKLGIDKPNLSLTGDYKFRIKSSSHWTNIDEDNGTANKVPNFEPDQEPNVNLVGSIGKLIHVQLSWTKDGFGVSNNQMLQIKYAGEKPEDTEDDILQEAEFGYINFALSGTSLTGYTEQASGLIGAKAKMKFGDLDATVIVGGEKGEKQHQKLGAGSTNNTQTIDDRSPAQGAFFLDQTYRAEFDNVAGNYSAMTAVDGVRLFVRVSATDAKNNPGWAPFWKGSAQGFDAGGLPIGAATKSDETWVELRSSDYSVRGGVVFLNNTTLASTAYNTTYGALGAIYKRVGGTVRGGTSGGKLNLVLLSLPTDPVEIRSLTLRNRYKMPFSSVSASDRAYVKVRVLDNSSNKSDKSVNEAGVDLAKYFGLVGDDGTVKASDKNIFDWDRMEISFPSASPFAKTGRTVLYDTSWTSLKTLSSRYSIEVTAKSRSSVFQVAGSSSVSSSNCLDIIEGSEVLTLNGSTKLVKGVDYDVSYSVGQITLLSSRALDPSADIQIDYQCTPFYSLDTKTLIGGRLEYELPVGKPKESLIGATMLYRSETVTDSRAQLGREPNSAWLWGANVRLQNESEWLSDLVGYVPLVTPHGDSRWKLELEMAQSYNNPNTDGDALVDDFESSKLGNSLPITRTSWFAASPPGGVSTDTSYDASHDYRHKGTFVWHSNSQVAKGDIYPKWDDGNGTRAKQYILQLKLQPNDPGLGYSWGGIMRALPSKDLTTYRSLDVVARGSGGVLYFDFGDISEAISIAGRPPSDTLKGEDVDSLGIPTGRAINGKDLGIDQIPDALETALRWYCPGVECGSPTVITHDQSTDPAGKQFNPQTNSSDPDPSINGTEGNNRYMDNGLGTWFDTEDLNNNGKLDVTNAFNRFAIHLGGDSATPYEKLRNGWRLYHIRLESPTRKVGGGASWDNISMSRIWYSGLTAKNGANQQEDRVQIADMSLTGSQYTESGRISRNDSTKVVDSLYTGGTFYKSLVTIPDTNSLRVGVVSSQSNNDIYESWGVPTSTDASTGAVQNEQSLRLQYYGLRAFGQVDSAAGTATRTFTDARNLTLYNNFKLQVYHHLTGVTVGGVLDTSELNRLRSLPQKPLRFTMRMGSGTPSDTTAQYYEYSWYLTSSTCALGDSGCGDLEEKARRAGMDENWRQNRLEIPLSVFTVLKDSGSTTLRKQRIYSAAVPQSKLPLDLNYAFRQDSVAIKGNPSLSNIQWIQYILRPDSIRAGERITGEVWLNDMKVENPEKGIGTAMRGSFEFNLADLFSASANASVTEGNFTPLGTRRTDASSEATVGSAGFDSRLSLNKFLPEAWKVQMPIGYSVTTSLSRPWVRPGSDISLTHDNIGDILSDVARGRVSRDSAEQSRNTARAFQTYSVSDKISWNYKKDVTSGRSLQGMLTNIFFERPRYSWVYTTAHSEQPERTDSSSEHSIEVDYDFSPKVKPWKPFRTPPSWMPSVLSQVELQPLPNKLDAVLMNLDYTESVRRTLDADNDTLIAVDRQRKATLSHSLSSEWALLNFFKMSHKIQVSRTFDSALARDFNPAAGFPGMAGQIFAKDTTVVDTVTGIVQAFGLLKGEQTRTQSLTLDLSPQLSSWLTTSGSFSSSSTLSRLSPTVVGIDTLNHDTSRISYWQGTERDGFRSQFRWNVSSFLSSLANLGSGGYTTSLMNAKKRLDAWKFSGLNLEYSNDNSTSGENATLAYMANRKGLDAWGLERYLVGLGDESEFRSPWDLVTGSRRRSGFGQYEPWRLHDTSLLNASKLNTTSSGADLTNLANQRTYRVSGSTDFSIPKADLTLRPSLSYSTSWTENWNDPVNVDTTTVLPQITVGGDWANFAPKFGFLSKFFQSVTMSHSIGWDITNVVHPHSQTSDTKTENWKFSPLVGLNLRTKSGIWTFDNKFNYSTSTTWNYNKVQLDAAPSSATGVLADPVYWYRHSGATIDSSWSFGDDFTATYRVQTKKGIQILKWFLRLDSDLLVSFIASYSNQQKIRNTIDSAGESSSRSTLTNLTVMKFGSETSYSFTPKLTARASAYYTRQKQTTSTSSSDATTTNDISMLLEIAYKF